jgi:iron complex transport system ATP-binding protein
MQLDFPGMTVEQDAAALVLHSEQPLHVLSSAVVGGGFVQTQTIINLHVDKHYDCSDPIRDLHCFAAGRGIADFVGLLTAVWMHKARSVTLRAGDLTVCAVITAGVSNAVAAGLDEPQTVQAGTINTVILVDGNLSPAAMVNAMMTITEAKTAVLMKRRVQTPEGYPATGTSTDAAVLACTGRGGEHLYGGPVTEVGCLIGRCMRACLELALDAA